MELTLPGLEQQINQIFRSINFFFINLSLSNIYSDIQNKNIFEKNIFIYTHRKVFLFFPLKKLEFDFTKHTPKNC